MSSISILNAMSLHFDNAWLLFLLIPAIGLALIPYFRVPKQHRNTRNRVISLCIHCVILFFAVLMLAGLSFAFTQVSVKKDVILLVDASDSASVSRAEMDEFVDSVLDEVKKSERRIGIVTFGGDCVYSAELSSDINEVRKAYSEQTKKPVGSATDISAALKYARKQLSSPKDGRIIVLSDGIQTDNNAMATVKALSDEGVRVDTVYFPSSNVGAEAQISGIEVQMSGGGADVAVAVQSTVTQSAKLKLYDGEELIGEQNVNLSGGNDTFSFDYAVVDSRVHVVRAELEPERDAIIENNVFYSYINVNASSKILLVDGSGNGAPDLTGLLDVNFDVTRVTVSELPNTLEALCEYGEVILMNVANSDLPQGFDDMLTDYVESYGGGLYTVGGGRAYVQEDMQDTKFEQLLPVNANTDAKSLGLLLIIDSSGSMRETASGTTVERMELAKEAAVASVNALAPDDYVGVISFNMESTIVSEMSSLDKKDIIIRRIRDIETATGTYYSKALEDARNMLQSFNKTELKHIIFLTDGEPVDPNKAMILDNVDRIARNNITLSTIALGSSVPTDTAKEMAERGGGRFYDVVRESELIKVMVEETTTASGKHLNEGEFTPAVVSHTSAVAGIDELPKLGGYYGTRIKEGATMVLGHEGSPIYAEWKRGEGRVGSFMCDLEGLWSAEYFTDPNGVKFVTNSIASVMSRREISNQTVSVDFSHDNHTVQTVIRAVLEKGESISAELIAPDGSAFDLLLDKLSSARFASSFKMKDKGLYTVRVTKSGGGESEQYSAYTAFSYSREYSAFTDTDADFAFMEKLGLEGKGSMLFSADKIFD